MTGSQVRNTGGSGGMGGGTVTSVDGSGGVTGMTLTGGPITTTGTLTLGGTLAVGSGGTGATTAAGARTNLSAQLSQQFQDENVNLGTSGTVDIINFTGAGITASRAGNTIMVDVPSSGTVTSVDVSGGATGLIATGGPITSSGVITLSGVLDVDNGGTGAITAAGARTNLAASPNNASYVVIANNTELTSERALAIEAGVLNLTDAGVNSTVTVGVAANGITNAKIRASNSLSVIGRSVNSIGNVADIQATAGGNKVLRETGSTLAFSNWIGSDSTQATLGSTFAITSSGTYQDTGLSVSLDSNSVYLLIQQVRAIVNVSLLSTGGTIFTRLFNVTNAAAITNTELLASFSGALNTDSQQCGSGMTIFTTGAAAPTVRLEAQRASGPTYTTSSILSSTSGRTRLIAIKIGSA